MSRWPLGVLFVLVVAWAVLLAGGFVDGAAAWIALGFASCALAATYLTMIGTEAALRIGEAPPVRPAAPRLEPVLVVARPRDPPDDRRRRLRLVR